MVYNSVNRNNRARNGEYIGPGAEGRTCGDCGEYKGADNYWVVKKTGNLFAYCKVCGAKRNRDRHQERYQDVSYRERLLAQQRAEKRTLKEAVIAAYGGGCACCGEFTFEFLTLDHVNNDGAAHRKETGLGSGIDMWRLARRKNYPDIFQILCWNCNSSKGAFGYCPHSQVLADS